MSDSSAAAPPARDAAATNRRPLDSTSVPPNPRPVDVLAAFRQAWAVAVATGAGPGGQPRQRRALYLTASAAQRAVEAAHERGQVAAAVLVELRPVADDAVEGGAR